MLGGHIGTITGDFVANGTSTRGGAMYNDETSSIDEINGSFLDNIVNNDNGAGGAIYNAGNIGTINADFIDNDAVAGSGGAILNKGSINAINGKFIDNFSERAAGSSVGGDGAGIKNDSWGYIGTITGVFIGQHTVNYGGGISNRSNAQIDTIIADFLNNRGTEGGGIRNNGNINLIQGNFTNNYTHEREGGAIANNKSGVIDNIVGNFTTNSALTNGGAIWNRNIINSVSGNFINNHADGYGGAIYQKDGAQMGIVAETRSVEITGNSDANGDANAIYQNVTDDSDNVINLNAAHGQSIVINDAITGGKDDPAFSGSNYININKTLSYDDIFGTTINLPTGGHYEINNTVSQNNLALFNNATLKLDTNTQGGTTYYGKLNLDAASGFGFSNDANGGILDTVNGHIDEQVLGLTTLASTLGINIDVDAENLVADTFNFTATTASTIQIHDIDWINGIEDFDGKIQILKNQDTTTFAELALSLSIMPDVHVVHHAQSTDLTTNSVNWDDVYGGYTYSTTTIRTLSLATTTTTNDSISLNTTVSDSPLVYSGGVDNLALINQYNDSTRTFNFDSETNEYVAIDDSGETFGGTLTINGVANGDDRSIINADNHTLFEITGATPTTVVINNTKVTGATMIANVAANNALVLNNVEISGNTGEITNNGTLTLNTNNIINDNVSGNGETIANDTVTIGASATIAQGTLTANSSANLTNAGNMAVDTLNNSGNIVNDGTFVVDSGTSVNGGAISGTGDITFQGALDNTAGTVANNSVTVDGGHITTAFDTFVTNSASDAINVIGGGEIEYTSGSTTVRDITGNAASNVRFKTGSDIVLNNNISGVTINHDSGTLLFGTGDLSGSAGLNMNGGAISVADGALNNVNLGFVQLNQQTELGIDLDLSTLTTDTFTASVANNGGIFNVSTINFQGAPTITDAVRMHLGDMTGLGQENVTSETFVLPEVVTPIHRLPGQISNGWLTYAPADNSYSSFNPVVMAAPVAAQMNGYLVMQNVREISFADIDLYRLGDKSGVHGNNSGVWVRPFGTFETVPIRYGPNVTSEMYGAMVGRESSVRELGDDWYGVMSLDAGYTLTRNTYDGVTVRQNGTSVGATGMVYNGGFFAGVNMHVGAMAGYEQSQYGDANFTLLNASAATKLGYNFELVQDSLYLQPWGMAGYTFVLPFDYINAAGTKITSKPLHALTMEPGLKLITSFAGWRPYAESSIVWNLFDKAEYSADSYELPIIRIEPYVKYGGGVEKTWGEHFSAYGKLYGMSIGRKGMGFQVGMKYVF